LVDPLLFDWAEPAPVEPLVPVEPALVPVDELEASLARLDVVEDAAAASPATTRYLSRFDIPSSLGCAPPLHAGGAFDLRTSATPRRSPSPAAAEALSLLPWFEESCA
jgi:hypothetical protein